MTIEMYASLRQCLPRGKVVADLHVESYGLQRASWDEVGAVIWVANRGKNIAF